MKLSDKAPCLNCPDRKVGCHNDCSKYNNFKSGRDELRAKIRAEKDRADNIQTYVVNSIIARKRRTGN